MFKTLTCLANNCLSLFQTLKKHSLYEATQLIHGTNIYWASAIYVEDSSRNLEMLVNTTDALRKYRKTKNG